MARKDFGAKPYTYPHPVFILATYNEDGTANAMNAAWGGISEGNDISFEIIGTVDYEGHLYAVMIPFDDEDDEVVILEIIPTENPDESEFLSVDDDDLLGEIFEEFKKNYDG